MLFIAVISTVSAFELVNILHGLNPELLKFILGYAVWLEIFFSVVLTAVAAATGTISGVAIASVTGFFITLTLLASRKILGYKKFRKVKGKFKFEVVEVPGTATSASVGSATRAIIVTVGQMVASFTRGFVSK